VNRCEKVLGPPDRNRPRETWGSAHGFVGEETPTSPRGERYLSPEAIEFGRLHRSPACTAKQAAQCPRFLQGLSWAIAAANHRLLRSGLDPAACVSKFALLTVGLSQENELLDAHGLPRRDVILQRLRPVIELLVHS